MKSELKQQWLEKLRSGEIKQAQSVLRDESNAMCCLGVLLDISDPNGWRTDTAYNSIANKKCYPHRLATGDHDFISHDERSALGLDFIVPHPNGMDKMNVAHRLTAMNDRGSTFAEIADWIEANIPAE